MSISATVPDVGARALRVDHVLGDELAQRRSSGSRGRLPGSRSAEVGAEPRRCAAARRAASPAAARGAAPRRARRSAGAARAAAGRAGPRALDVDVRLRHAPAERPLPDDAASSTPASCAARFAHRRRARGSGAAAGAAAASSRGLGRAPTASPAAASAPRAQPRCGALAPPRCARARAPTGTTSPSAASDRLDHARRGRRDLGVDLVGRDLDDRLVLLDPVAFLHQPARDRAFEDALAERRKLHRDAHLRLLPMLRPVRSAFASRS